MTNTTKAHPSFNESATPLYLTVRLLLTGRCYVYLKSPSAGPYNTTVTMTAGGFSFHQTPDRNDQLANQKQTLIASIDFLDKTGPIRL